MRRTAFMFFPVLFFVILTGCGKQEIKAAEINFAFQCKADIVCDQQKITCEMSRTGPGMASFQILSGDLNGLTYYWSGEDFSVSYSGLAAKSDACILPKTSFASVLQQTLDYASKSGTLTKTHGNEFSGSLNGCDFTVTADDTGQIQKISIPKRGITAELYEYTEQGL
jgi:hypothetical protein